MRIIRPIKEIYHWKGYLLTCFFAAGPWAVLGIVTAKKIEFPRAEFQKFLIGMSLLALFIFLQTSWWNLKIFRFRKARLKFRESAQKTAGRIINAEKVLVNPKLEETCQTGKNSWYVWKIGVGYYNIDKGTEEAVYSEYYYRNPLKKVGVTEVDVYYDEYCAYVGDFMES